MELTAKFEDLQKKSADANAAVKSAVSESRDQLRQRIEQAQVDLDLADKDAKQRAAAAGDRAQSKWAQMRADASSKVDNVKAKIDKRNTEIDAKLAENDAEWAESDALDAIDYAAWTVENARLAALDALDARVYADERAKDAGH